MLKAAIALYIASKTIGSKWKLGLSSLNKMLGFTYKISLIAQEERNSEPA